MPQLQPLVLTDRADTPVDHTFTPLDIQGGVGTVVESTGTPIGDNRVTVSLGKTNAGRYKAVVKFVLPIVQEGIDASGITRPVVVRTSYVEITASFDQSSTEQERDDAIGMVESALAADSTLINDVLVKLQGVY